MGTGQLLWFTGLSAAGKTTLANAVAHELGRHGLLTQLVDGDALRSGFCADLGYTETDRRENARRVGGLAQTLVNDGVIVLAALISPYRTDRQWLREQVGGGRFFEVYCDCPLAVCEARDPKGLYRRARAGEVALFTGIDAPYEPSAAPDLHLRTDQLSVQQCVDLVLAALRPRIDMAIMAVP
jgi:adenylylsulfate kinase